MCVWESADGETRIIIAPTREGVYVNEEAALNGRVTAKQTWMTRQEAAGQTGRGGGGCWEVTYSSDLTGVWSMQESARPTGSIRPFSSSLASSS